MRDWKFGNGKSMERHVWHNLVFVYCMHSYEHKHISHKWKQAYVAVYRWSLVHPNLFTFLGHLQHTTAVEVGRLSRGMLIRRAKKRVNLDERCTDQSLPATLWQRRVYANPVFVCREPQFGGACSVRRDEPVWLRRRRRSNRQRCAFSSRTVARPLKSAWLRSAMHAMHWSLAAINVSVRRVRHGWKRKLVAGLFVALLSPWCCVCIRLGCRVQSQLLWRTYLQRWLHTYNIFVGFFSSIQWTFQWTFMLHCTFKRTC